MTDQAPIRTILVDDHELFREGLAQLLETEESIDVIATGKDGSEAVNLAREHQPDVAVVDVEMPGDGIDSTLAHIREVAPKTKVVIITMHNDGPLIHAGAAAFVAKTVGRQELVAAVKSALNQSDDLVTIAAPRASFQDQPSTPAPGEGSPVSSREIEILTLLAQAHSNADIARQLFITEGTVKRHLNNIYRKLDVKSRMEAAQAAEQLGLI